jgi:RNA polymerase sigma-70 factor (ECF subfamily)
MLLFQKNQSIRSDEELMSLLTNGGQSAFDELYKRYSKPMLNFFYRLLDRDRERAEDMLHDLFLKIIERPERYDSSRSFRAWFYTLAGNMVRNEFRSRQISNDYERVVSVQSEMLTDGPEVALDRQLFERQLQWEIDRFDPEQKMLFQFRFVEEMTVRQIAEIIECPEGTVKSRLFHLTRLLAKKLSIYKPL